MRITLIVAYLDGKWFVKIGDRIYSNLEHTNVGLDGRSRLFQLAMGQLYWRWTRKTRQLDIAQWIWGKYSALFETVGEAKSYRFKGHVFELQPVWKYDYRPRRGKYNRSAEPWTLITSINGEILEDAALAYQDTSNPVEAMSRFLWMVERMRGCERGPIAKSQTYLV
jgi:hypothetical protein